MWGTVQILEDERIIVYACARRPSSSAILEECKRKYGARLHLMEVDVSDDLSIQVSKLSSLPEYLA